MDAKLAAMMEKRRKAAEEAEEAVVVVAQHADNEHEVHDELHPDDRDVHPGFLMPDHVVTQIHGAQIQTHAAVVPNFAAPPRTPTKEEQAAKKTPRARRLSQIPQLEAQAKAEAEAKAKAEAEALAAAEAKVKATHEETLRAEAAKLAAEEADAMALLEKQKKEGGVTAPAGAPPLAVTVSKGGSESGSAASTPRGGTTPGGRDRRPSQVALGGTDGARRRSIRRASAAGRRESNTPGRSGSIARRASIAAAHAGHVAIKKTASVVGDLREEVADVISAIAPPSPRGVQLDVLGLPTGPDAAPPPPPGAMGAPRGLSSLGLGDEPASEDEGERESLTSEILAGGSDWAAEFLLLTHEPLRRDMDEMTRALQPSFFGYLPESRRVRAFFRYFQGWCSLVAQQHAVEIAVHVDWLGAAKTTQSTGGPPALADDYRIGLMDYQRGVELALLNVSRMEARIIEELTMAADWNTTDPWSQQVCWGAFWGARPPSPATPRSLPPPRRLTPSPSPPPSQADELRNMLDELFTTMRDHLSQQETKLPAIFRDKWGAISPPQLVTRSLAAAKRAQAGGARGGAEASLLSWVVYYLRLRDETRAKFFVAALPFGKRIKLAFTKKGYAWDAARTRGNGVCGRTSHPPHHPPPPQVPEAPRLPQLDRPRRRLRPRRRRPPRPPRVDRRGLDLAQPRGGGGRRGGGRGPRGDDARAAAEHRAR